METNKVVIESLAMNGGVGDHSYANNSSLQRSGFEAAKALIYRAIKENLDIKHLSRGRPFRITDLGCSVGPNTFIAVQNIVEAIEQKHQSQGLKLPLPEFHVYFNDHVSNDFNTLFASFPLERRYFAAGVPGSFHSRLFPEKSINLVYSFASLQWLSKVPDEVLDMDSTCWNKGRIYYTNAPSEVMAAYSGRFAKDMERFLDARAKEVVHGGLLALSFPCIPDGLAYSRSQIGGRVDEAKVDSFNVPFYSTASPMEVENLVAKNGCFTIERNEAWACPILEGNGACEMYSKHYRAFMEGLIKEHFGSDDEIIEELFKIFTKKISDSFDILEESNMSILFVLLKRKEDS
ncbi:hypothetical protein Sjap_024542 [Stephania japonica]|uniref:Uncharacterized protein n=1 Tax=Stephania japonica TaxID=461633 RepID=A0AAP0HQ84_9MAGN